MSKLSFISFFSRFLFIVSSFFIISCNNSTDTPNPNEEVPLGQVWAEVDGNFLRFDDFSGIAPQDANSYASSVRLMSIYRQVSSGNIFGTLSIKLSPVNLDEVETPQDFAQNVIIIFNPQPNVLFTGKDGAMQLQITSIEGDVVKGTFSGTVRGNNNPNQTFSITNGKFNIKLERF